MPLRRSARMPDENKFAKLREIDYRVRPCCRACIHYGWEKGGTVESARSIISSYWRRCGKHTYQHKKHSGGPHHISVHAYGCCEKDFEENPAMPLALVWESFIEFLQEQ